MKVVELLNVSVSIRINARILAFFNTLSHLHHTSVANVYRVAIQSFLDAPTDVRKHLLDTSMDVNAYGAREQHRIFVDQEMKNKLNNTKKMYSVPISELGCIAAIAYCQHILKYEYGGMTVEQFLASHAPKPLEPIDFAINQNAA